MNIHSLSTTKGERPFLECPENLNNLPGDITCTKYFSCTNVTGTILLKTFTCPFGQYFHRENQSCVYGFTSACANVSHFGKSLAKIGLPESSESDDSTISTKSTSSYSFDEPVSENNNSTAGK